MPDCACCKGACCDGATCSLTTKAECEAADGMFRGTGTDCDPDPCAVCSGCCQVDGVTDPTVTTEEACATTDPVYQNQCWNYFEAADASECPAGWDFEAGYGRCILKTCVADCEECVAAPDAPAGVSLDCNYDPLEEFCPATYPGVWHEVCPEPVCLDYVHSANLSPEQQGSTFFEETINVPTGCDTVVLRGSVDDDIRIDGAIIQDGEFTTETYPVLNPAHAVLYEFTPTGSSFTIAVKDNWGIATGVNLRICFYASVGAMALSLPGPGTELKRLLAGFGIHATPTCKCNKMAKQMNQWGPDECLNHIDEIVDVMAAEAAKRKLPFLRTLGKALVRKAVRRSRGNSK